MALDSSHGTWSSGDSAQSLLADIVEDTHSEAEREKRQFAELLEQRAAEIERDRQRRLERERQTARIRISIEEERCAARERRAKMKQDGLLGQKRRTWALPSPRAREQDAPKPLSARLPTPPEPRSPRSASTILPAPSDIGRKTTGDTPIQDTPTDNTPDEASAEGYEIIASIPTPETGLPRVEPPPPPSPAAPAHSARDAATPAARRSSSPAQHEYTEPPRTIEAVLVGIILVCAAMCVGFYWADNPPYEPDLATYMKAHYKPATQIDSQKEVGFVPTRDPSSAR